MTACPKCERGGTGPHPAGCTPETRFWRKIKRVGACWEWQGARHPFGYGQFRVGNGTKRGVLVSAHRFAYEATFGAIADGLHVMHTCDNPACCRPAHLILGTALDNMRDCVSKGRHKAPVSLPKTHCKHGHEFTPENTYTDKDGWKSCRTCHRIGERERKRRLAA